MGVSRGEAEARTGTEGSCVVPSIGRLEQEKSNKETIRNIKTRGQGVFV